MNVLLSDVPVVMSMFPFFSHRWTLPSGHKITCFLLVAYYYRVTHSKYLE